jgi:hypothetical protein
MERGCGDEVVGVNCVRSGGGGDPGEYAEVLKRKLELCCAAVAKSMVLSLLEGQFSLLCWDWDLAPSEHLQACVLSTQRYWILWS